MNLRSTLTAAIFVPLTAVLTMACSAAPEGTPSSDPNPEPATTITQAPKEEMPIGGPGAPCGSKCQPAPLCVSAGTLNNGATSGAPAGTVANFEQGLLNLGCGGKNEWMDEQFRVAYCPNTDPYGIVQAPNGTYEWWDLKTYVAAWSPIQPVFSSFESTDLCSNMPVPKGLVEVAYDPNCTSPACARIPKGDDDAELE